MFKFTKFFIIAVFVIIIGTIVFRASLVYNNMKNGKSMYEITVPAYNGTTQTYITSEYYYDQNKCLVFKDEFGFEQRVCDQHTITKW